MDEYKTLSCVRGYHEYQSLDGGSGGRTSVQKGKAMKSNGSLCCCSKGGYRWYHSWQKHTINSENVQCC